MQGHAKWHHRNTVCAMHNGGNYRPTFFNKYFANQGKKRQGNLYFESFRELGTNIGCGLHLVPDSFLEKLWNNSGNLNIQVFHIKQLIFLDVLFYRKILLEVCNEMLRVKWFLEFPLIKERWGNIIKVTRNCWIEY